MKVIELEKVASERIGRVDKHNVDAKPHEESTALHLAQFGFNVDFIMPRNTYKSKSADFLVNGAVWETKSPEGGGNSTVGRQFHEASKQADRLILDLRRIKLPADKAKRQALARFEKAVNIKRLLLITKEGRLLDIKR